MFAGRAYSMAILKEGLHALEYLHDLAGRQEATDVCCELPESVLDGIVANDDADTSMFGATSLLDFARLIGDAKIDTVVKVLYTSMDPAVGHIVVVGPNCFQLCSCLQILRTGLPCRHLIAVLLWCVKRPTDFSGLSLHPRWRTSTEAWSMEQAGLHELNVHGSGTPSGGVTDDCQMDCGDGGEGGGDGTSTDLISGVRERNYANWMAQCTAAVKLLCDGIDAKNPGFEVGASEIIARLVRDASAHVQSKGLPLDSHDSTQLSAPPILLSESRKETRAVGACEGGPQKKRKEGDGDGT